MFIGATLTIVHDNSMLTQHLPIEVLTMPEQELHKIIYESAAYSTYISEFKHELFEYILKLRRTI